MGTKRNYVKRGGRVEEDDRWGRLDGKKVW